MWLGLVLHLILIQDKTKKAQNNSSSDSIPPFKQLNNYPSRFCLFRVYGTIVHI